MQGCWLKDHKAVHCLCAPKLNSLPRRWHYQKLNHKNMANQSPYLSNAYRLTDVIAAIQILGSARDASCPWESWAKKLDRPLSAENWKMVFVAHPEFFRVSEPDKLDGKVWVSLRWRHAYDKVFDTEAGKELSDSEKLALEGQLNNKELFDKRVIRKRLASAEIETLIKTAIELHERSIAYAAEKRWLIPMLFALGGVILGAILQAALK